MSILTPSFQQAAWLSDNLRSVAAQTYPHLEHVVVDGGSTDGSVQILKDSDERVIWMSESDAGQSDAINKAFHRSSGSILGWLNSDDAYFDQFAVERAVAIFQARPDVDLVYGHCCLAGASGLVLQLLWVPTPHQELLRYHNYIAQPTCFIRRSAIDGPLVDPRYDYTMDRELWLRLMSRGSGVARVDAIQAIDRHYAERKSYQRLDLAETDTKRLVAEYGVATGLWASTVVSALSILFRLRAAVMIPQIEEVFAFDGFIDGRWRLFLRQVFVKRRHMSEPSIRS